MSKTKGSLVPASFKDEQEDLIKVDEEARAGLAKFRKQREKEREPRRIIFAYDATGSRSHVWDLAQSIQANMVADALQYGNVEMRIVAYRDRFADPDSYIEYSNWSNDGEYLQKYIGQISCYGGGGNGGESIDAALEFALEQYPSVNAIVLVGDEPVHPNSRTTAYNQASELGKKEIPIFTFHEGNLSQAKSDFETIAERSGGIYKQFTKESKLDLGDHLRVVAVYATGGKTAVDDYLKKLKYSKARGALGASVDDFVKRLK